APTPSAPPRSAARARWPRRAAERRADPRPSTAGGRSRRPRRRAERARAPLRPRAPETPLRPPAPPRGRTRRRAAAPRARPGRPGGGRGGGGGRAETHGYRAAPAEAVTRAVRVEALSS